MGKEVKPLLSEEEQLALAEFKKKKRIDLCVKELNELLGKHQCRLGVDPNSPIGNPQIVVTDQE